jgi:hypothetical protein
MITPPQPNLDDALIAEVEELFRHHLAAKERDGLSTQELQQLAERFYRMYDLLDNCIQQQATPRVDRALRNETYNVIADGFMDKLHTLYDDNIQLSDTQIRRLIEQTRHKLHRLRRLLEC